MFVFYNIRELLMLEQLQVIKLVAERGFVISVPDLRLGEYSGPIYRQIESLAERKLVEIKEQSTDVYDFVEMHIASHSTAGKSLLSLLHFCKTAGEILVVDKKELIVNQEATSFAVATSSLVEFYKETINDEKYTRFIMDLKKEEIKI
jgi:hypothetical protein